MTERSLILLMTVESHWKFVCGAGQMIKGFDAAVADMKLGQYCRYSSDAGRSLWYAGSGGNFYT